MKTKTIKHGILMHKLKSPKTYNENIKISVPFFVLYQKIFSGITNILEKKYSLTNTELDVLSSLVIGGGDNFTLSPTELYKRIIFSSGGLTKILKRLEMKKYIKRVEGVKDKRIKLVLLTIKGRNIFDKALKDSIEYESKYFECLSHKDKNTLSELIFKVLDNEIS